MTEEQFQQLVDLLGELGSAAYALAVRQAQIEAVTSLISALGFIVLGIVAYRVILWGKEKVANDDSNPGGYFALLFGAVGGVVGLVGAVDCVIQTIHYAINPQWAALAKLAELVR